LVIQCAGSAARLDVEHRVLKPGSGDVGNRSNLFSENGGMRHSGTVKFFNQAKGFGFIIPDDGGADIFVHVSAVQRSGLETLADGARVSYETEPDKRGKGPKAINLQLI
jgi:cold shock protein